MAGTQDPLTDLPPPSRLDFEELSNFSFGAPSAPPPLPAFVSWAGDGELKAPLHPRLLFIASSPSGLHLIRYLPGKHLLGSVLLPAQSDPNEENLNHRNPHDNGNPTGFSDDGNLKGKSIYDARNPRRMSSHVCDIYSLDAEQASVVLVAVESPVAEERANSWAKVLLKAIVAESVVMVAMVQRDNFRGKLSADDEVVFRLETDAMRAEGVRRAQGDVSMKDPHRVVPYFPSGSVVSGVPAAVLTRCQLIGLNARLLLSWPEAGPQATSFLASVLQGFPDTKTLDFGCSLQVPFKGKSVSDLDIYF